MATPMHPHQTLLAENAELVARLAEAEDMLRAIRGGEVDAFVVDGPDGQQIFTLQGTDAESSRFRGEILAQIGEAVLAVDRDQRVTYLNPAAERLYGVAAAEALGRRLTELYESRPVFQDHDRDMTAPLHEDGTRRIEQINLTRDGRELQVELSDTPLLDRAGQPAGRLSVIRNITARKSMEGALRASEERFRALAGQLEQAVSERTQELVQSQEHLRALAMEMNLAEHRERTRLAGDLHDYLAQLLVLCRINLGQVRRAALPSKAEETLKEAQEALDNALNYTRTLMAELSPPILREQGLSSGLRWLGQQMERRNLTVRVDVGDTADLILPGDCAVLLFQSVRELLLNVLKHAKSEEAAVRLEQTDGRLRIEICDHGAGFDPAALAHNPTALSSRFGLFSIRERMKSLGGWFNLKSSPGAGTTATLVLPLGIASAASSEFNVLSSGLSRQAIGHRPTAVSPRFDPSELRTQNAQLHPQHATPIRVLLVDDHPMVRQGLRTVLDSYPDLDVVGEARNGKEAVACAERLQPSIVLMDINMPEMNGIDATAEITSRYPHIVVIGLSVQAGGANEEAMREAGAAMLLTKEAAADELYQAIWEALGRKQS